MIAIAITSGIAIASPSVIAITCGLAIDIAVGITSSYVLVFGITIAIAIASDFGVRIIVATVCGSTPKQHTAEQVGIACTAKKLYCSMLCLSTIALAMNTH